MLLFLYSLLVRLVVPVILVRFWWLGRSAPGLRQDIRHRLGWGPRPDTPVLWVHAASVGEVIAAAAMVRRLLADDSHPQVLVTTMTDTGRAQARKLFGSSVLYAYVPLDTPGAVRRFVKRVKPTALAIIETEIWPNLVTECDRCSVPVLLINARLSERSARGYQRFQRLARPVMARLSWVAAQAPADAARFAGIGVPGDRIEVTGSVKFDITVPAKTRQAAAQCRDAFGGPRRSVWIAGSTHEGEDAALLQAHRRVLMQHPDALLVIVPRHPDRFEAVASLVQHEGLSLARRSRQESAESAQVYLGDTMGELMMLYGAGDLAFVGGSLIERGGHNPMEPAVWGIPVLSGPHVFNFETVYRELQEGQGVRIIREVDDLAQAVSDWFSEPGARHQAGERANAVVRANQGALERVVNGVLARAVRQ